MWARLGDLALRLVLWAFLLIVVGGCVTIIVMAARAQYAQG